MLLVEAKVKPNKFYELVERPGQEFIQRNPYPTEQEWLKHNYWKRISKDLHSSYNGICAYSCHWISYDTGWKTVEHFLPKSQYPELAYDWNNYRLVCGILNSRKGVREILDPFSVKDGWFIIDFPSLLVKPSSYLDDDLYKEVERTRDILGLNDEDTCLKTRNKYLEDYCKNEVSFNHLRTETPFLARELERQGLVNAIIEIMSYP